MKKNGLLRSLGFSNHAEKVYVTLLEKGERSLAEISRFTGLYRPAVYRALPELIEANLVAPAKRGKRTVYVAESPNLLSSLAKEKMMTLESSLPQYLNLYLNRTKRPKFTVYQGAQGIKSVYEYLIANAKKEETIFRYESPRDHTKLKEYYPELYWQRASRAGDMNKFVITNELTHHKRRESINRSSKAIPKSYDTFDYNITQLVCGDKVAFLDFDTETAILIENARFAEFQKKLFQLFFRRL
jgi:sugar-specific transcriptional regulator TrmB